MKRIKNRLVRMSLCIIGIGIIVLGGVYGNTIRQKENQFTAEQIETMRAKYPLGSEPEVLESKDVLSLEAVIERGDTFVYGEIIGDKGTYTKNITSWDIELDAKLESKGMNTVSFYEYPLRMLSDSEGILKTGDEITIFAPKVYEGSYPELSKGMKVVVPILTVPVEKHPEWRKEYTLTGSYYVTEDGYAIAAFDEAQAPSTLTRSGYTSGL
ncbi:MAG: hypothetical protein ACLRVT_09480, partial [Oscillospiraceae bacterium]